MKQFVLVFTIFIGNIFSSVAQDRYFDHLFDEIKTETHTYASKDGADLELDVYSPEYDADAERATIIYVHGGGFQTGNRNEKGTVNFCTKLAQYGYVVASISYRLTRKNTKTGFGCDCPANEKLNTFYAAVEDIQDATFFLIQNREYLGINPQKIILAGSSAGAEAVLNTAYQPPFCYGLDSGPVSVAGVISMAGAIPDLENLYDESAVPSLFFHGTDDNLVPYATAPHHYCEKDKEGYLILNGAFSIAEKLKNLEVPFWLHTTCGGQHELSWTPKEKYFDEIIDFCYNFVLNENEESRYTTVEGEQNTEKYESVTLCSE